MPIQVRILCAKCRTLSHIIEHKLRLLAFYLTYAHSLTADLRLVVPETHVGGKLYELYKQYNEELYMDRIRPAAVVTGHADLIDVQFEASDLVPDAEGSV